MLASSPWMESGAGCSNGLEQAPWWVGRSIRVWLVGRKTVDVAHRADRVADRHFHPLAGPVRRRTFLPGQDRQRPTTLPASGGQLLLAAQIGTVSWASGPRLALTSLGRSLPGSQWCN